MTGNVKLIETIFGTECLGMSPYLVLIEFYIESVTYRELLEESMNKVCIHV